MNEGLYESDRVFEIDEQDADDNYMYFSKIEYTPFCLLDEDLRSLNDYCLFLLESINNKIMGLHEEVKELKSGNQKYLDEELGDVTEDVLMGLVEFKIPNWENNRSFVVKSTCVMLLISFLEMALKSICDYIKTFAATSNKFIYEKSKDKISNYKNMINCYLDKKLEFSNEVIEGLDKARRYRNKFAHGDWEEVQFDKTLELSLRDLIAIISEIMTEIENKLLECAVIS